MTARLAWSQATWGPNGLTLFEGRKTAYPVYPRGDDPKREMLRDTLRPYFNRRTYRDACAMVEVLLIARGYGEADMVNPVFMEFLNATDPKDCRAIREFIWCVGPMMAALRNVRF